MKKILIILPLAVCLFAKAQTNIDREFDVVRAYRPVLSDAVKIKTVAPLEKVSPPEATLSYQVSPFKVDSVLPSNPLTSAELQRESIKKLYGNYIKGGFGNSGLALGEIYLSSIRDREYNYGFELQHLNGRTSDSRKFNRDHFNLYGQKYGSNRTSGANLYYNRLRVDHLEFPEDSLADYYFVNEGKHSFNTVGTDIDFFSNNKNLEDLNFAAKLKAYSFTDNYEQSENNVSGFGTLSQNFGKSSFAAEISADKTWLNQRSKSSNLVVGLQPYYRYVDSLFTLNLGLNTFTTIQITEDVQVYPNISGQFKLADRFLIAFAGLTGKTTKNSWKGFVEEMPYLQDTVEIKNTKEKLHFYGGFKGSLTDQSSFKIQGSVKKVDEMPLFVNRFVGTLPDFSTYEVIYDTATVTELSLIFTTQMLEKARIMTRFDLTNYSMTTAKAAYHLPSFKSNTTMSYNIADKILMTGDLLFYGKTQALAANGVDLIENKSFADVNISFDYRYSPKLSFFLQANNLANKTYQRFYLYPTQGFTFIAGATFAL
ncbi:MAG: hypothetical protein ACJAZ3_001544 [Sphingobacteriales bacterium]|jgi:hypothetical protein